MRRRDFAALAGAAVAWPFAAHAQRARPLQHVGILLFAPQDRSVIQPCLDELAALGYADGKNVTLHFRDAEGQYERLPELAADLVRLRPDVIFSFGGEQAPLLKQATSSIPIVVVVSNDPVATGLVASLARPGGNITGITYVHDQLAGKTVELLKDAAPHITRVGLIWNPNHTDPEFRATQRAAPSLGVELHSLETRTGADFEDAFQMATRHRVEALIVLGSRIMQLNGPRIGAFASRNRLILAGTPKWLLQFGALLTYGPNGLDLNRRAAGYVAKILKGARPDELPMQQPATFDLVLNARVAKALAVTIPPSLLARADEVFQ